MTAKPLRIVPSSLPTVPPRDARLRHGARVVIVDDRSTARSLLEGLARTLEPDVVVESFADPLEALAQMQLATPDLIISDYRMPGMDGIEFTRRIRAERCLADVPMIIVTVVEDRQIRYQALENGATDFLTRPIDPQECRARCLNLLALRRSQKMLSDRAQWLEEQVVLATREVRTRERETLMKLAKAGEYRDADTGNHIIRMSKYARLIAEELRLTAMECDEIEAASPMHDIGKIGIPDQILLKPGPPHAGRAGHHASPSADRPRNPGRQPFTLPADGRGDRARPPRKIRRQRLSARPGRRGHPVAGAHCGGGRRIRRAHLQTPLQSARGHFRRP